MKKPVRYLAIGLGVLAGLLVVLFALARFLISSEQVRKTVLPMARESLHRDVQLGDIDISLFSGIVLHDLEVKERDGEETFLAARQVALRYRFWPLLLLRVVVDEVRLEQPVLRVVRLPDGTFNFSDLTAPRETPAKQKPPADASREKAAPLNLFVSRVALTGGKLLFTDHRLNPGSPPTFALTDLDIQAENIALDQPFPVTVGAAFNKGLLALDGQVDIQTKAGRLKLRLTDIDIPDLAPYYRKSLPGQLRSLKLSGELQAEGNAQRLQCGGRIDLRELDLVTSAHPDVPIRDLAIGLQYQLQADLAGDHLELTSGRLQVGALPVELRGQMESLTGQPRLQGRVTLPDVDLKAVMDSWPAALVGKLAQLKPAGLVHARLDLAGPLNKPRALMQSGEIRLDKVQATVAGQRPRLTGSLTLSGDSIKGRQLALMVGEDRVLLDMEADNLLSKPIRVRSALTADRLQLDALPGAPADPDAARKPKAGRPVGARQELGPYDLPVQAAGTLQVGQSLWHGMVIDDLTGRYQLKDNVFTLEQLTGKVAGGTFSKTARIDLRQKGLAYHAHIETHGVQADPLFTALAPKAAGTVFGEVNLALDMQGRGTGMDAIKQNLTGGGDLKMADGKITGAGLASGLADFLELEELRVLRFSEAAGKLTVKNGQVQVNADLSGQDVGLTPTGSVGLDGSLNIALPVCLSPELTARLDTQGRFSRFLTDAQGWGQLPLKVAGTLTKPSFALDTAALGKALRQGVRQQLQKTLEKTLRPSQETEKPQTEEEQKPEEKLLEGVIKELFK
jgi:AsmA protein